MLFKKIAGGNKYLRKIDNVEYLRKSDFEGEYWPYIHDEVAYYLDENGYFTAGADEIVEANETEVVRVFGNNLYKWKE
jgi:hypothetical protein